jgi:hypothetical protein
MATLTNTPIVLATTLAAFKTRVPALNMLSIDATADEMKLNQQAIAHIRSLPTAGTYDSSTGYFNGANNQAGLLTDVPVTMDQHAHVTLSLNYLATLGDQKIDMALEDAAYVLGKRIVDSALTKAALAANTTYNEIETVANTDLDTLRKIRTQMNANKADPLNRFGLVSSAVAAKLDTDPMIASKDYHGQQGGGEGLLRFTNVGGFREIMEYPDLPTTATLQGLFFDQRLMVVKTALPQTTVELAASMGFAQTEVLDRQTDPESGITLMMIKHTKPGTLDKFISFVMLYGSAAGAQGGSAGALTDKAGVRLITTAP